MNSDDDVGRMTFVPLADDLLAAWRQLNAAAPVLNDDEPLAINAYLVLNRWDDNPLAGAIEAEFPALAQARCAVPDAYFEHREGRAPCLLPLPEALAPHAAPDTLAAGQARAALAQWLASGWEQTLERLSRQDLCGVVFAPIQARRVAEHWVQLGFQRPPEGGAARLLRYQDPRVMQRVWPLLAPHQQRQWLGPVAQWWALAQIWGPWDRAAPPPAPQWFRAVAPPLPKGDSHAAPEQTCPAALLNVPQWRAAHACQLANSIWAAYADQRVPADHQPDGDTMLRLLANGQGLGLASPNLEDYVYASWRHAAPEGQPRELAWHAPAAREVLAQALQTLRQQPDARFAHAFMDAMRRRRAR